LSGLDRSTLWQKILGVPDIVMECTRAAGKPKPHAPFSGGAQPAFPEPSEGRKTLSNAVLTVVLHFVCALVSIPMSIWVKRKALDELLAIAERRRSPAEQEQALWAYWIAEVMLGIWTFTLILLIVILAVMLIPILIAAAASN